MARFTTIEINFPTAAGKRKVIIRPDGRVHAIILNGEVPPKAKMPVGIEMDNAVGLEDGDGPMVCYMIGGVLECW